MSTRRILAGVRGELLGRVPGAVVVAPGRLRLRPLLGLGAQGAARPALRHLLDHLRHVGVHRGAGTSIIAHVSRASGLQL